MRSKCRVFILALLYTALPLAGYALRYKVIAPLYLFANDAFYYLDIARHSVGAHGFSFDGEFVTNGFHPLWEYLLVGLGKSGLVHYSQTLQPLLVVFSVNVLLLGLGSAIFCVAAMRYVSRPLLTLLIVAPGLFWLFAAPLCPAFFSTWSYANGMESAVALFCFAVAFLLLKNELGEDRELSTTDIALVSFWLGLSVLSRLDDVFLALPLLAWMALRSHKSNRLANVAALSILPIMLTCYVVYNRVSVGTFLPISGATKAGLGLGLNLKWLVREFLPVMTGDGPTALLARKPAYFGFGEISSRLIQMVLPAVLCAVELTWSFRKRGSSQWFSPIHAVACGVIVKAAYNFLFVQSWNQGQWYYTVSVAIANLILVMWLDRLVERLWPQQEWKPKTKLLLLAGHFALVLLAFNIFISIRNAYGPAEDLKLLEDPSPMLAKLRSLDADRIVEFDDGFVSYASQKPALAGLGLALDLEGAKAVKQEKFFDLLYARGYRILVAHGAYALILDDVVQSLRDGVTPQLAEIHPAEFKRYTIVPLGEDGSGDTLKYYVLTPLPKP